MKKIIKAIGALVLLLIIAGGITFFFFPQTLIDFTNSSYANAAHLKEKTIDLNGYEVHYFESPEENKQEVLVLVHGMGDDKNSFLQSAAKLSEHYHLILPDLAGHSANTRNDELDYSIDGQATFLHDFLEKIGVEKFDLVGNSMGGHTAAAYAIKYSEEVKNLVLLNAAGLQFDGHVVYTGFGKNIESDEEFDAVIARVFYKAPSIPGPIKKHMIEQVNESKDFVDNTMIPAIKNGKYFDLKDDLSQVNARTLVLWGKHDKVVQFKAAEYFRDHIPNAELVLIENGAHSPQLEVPEVVATEIISFLQGGKAN